MSGARHPLPSHVFMVFTRTNLSSLLTPAPTLQKKNYTLVTQCVYLLPMIFHIFTFIMQTDYVLCDVGTSLELSEPKVLSFSPVIKVVSHTTVFHFLFSFV